MLPFTRLTTGRPRIEPDARRRPVCSTRSVIIRRWEARAAADHRFGASTGIPCSCMQHQITNHSRVQI
jgi:hypothetical protein